MDVDVVWLSLHRETPARGYWDQAIVEHLLAGRWRAPCRPAFTHHEAIGTLPGLDSRGAVVVVPARHHAGHAPHLDRELAALPWVLLILTGDEEGVFPVERLTHPHMRAWVQTPQPSHTYPPGTRWLPNGPTPAAYEQPWGERARDVVFAGQVTHPRREDCANAVQRLLNLGCTGAVHPSTGFTQGLPPGEYTELMASARACPAPSGPVHVDTFRAWEAFEVGAVPVLDTRTPVETQADYWAAVAPGVPAPLVTDWADDLPGIVDTIAVDRWPAPASRAAAWWMGYQRRLAHRLADDLAVLSGTQAAASGPDDLVTVLVPTSPIPSHPSTAVIGQTIDSVRAQLPHAEILIMCDGPNPQAEYRRHAYEAYLYELVRLCRETWSNVLPVIHGGHLHQSGMTARTLDLVTTPLVLFVEHDTPLGGTIDWAGLTAAVTSGDAGIIRLHHEASILPEHQHLMLGPARPVGPAGVPLVPTQQWSQRPHLASTDLYRRMLADHLAGHRMMIEDKMHGVVQDDYGVHGLTGWEKWRLHIYAQPDPMHGLKRSWHTDGRDTDEKWVGQ